MARRDRPFPPGGPNFAIRERRDPDGTLILALYGDLDIQTAPTLAERMAAAAAPGAKLVLDFNALDFMDSSGLGALLAATKQAQNLGCDVSLIRPQDGLMRLLRVTGVDTMLPLRPDPGGGEQPHGRRFLGHRRRAALKQPDDHV